MALPDGSIFCLVTSRLGPPSAIASATLWGLQFSLVSPVIAILLVELYGATPVVVGALLAASNAFAFVVSLLLPRYSDRSGDFRLPMIVAGASGVLLALTFALAPNLVVAGVGMVLFSGPAGVGMALFWGYLRRTGADARQIINLRSLFSAAWVAGPPFGTLVLGLWGARVVPWMAAVVCAGALAASLMLLRRGDAAPLSQVPRENASATRVVMVAFVAFTLLQTTNSAVVSTLTLIVREHLGLDVTWAGLALGLGAGLEVPSLLLLGRLMTRFSTPTLVASGCLAGLAYYVGLLLTTSPFMLLALQLLNGYFVAVLVGAGLTWFQELMPGAAFAAGLFTNTNRVGAILSGGLIASATSTPWGFGGVLVTNVAVCAVAFVMLFGLAWVRRRPDAVSS